ncbi:MAG TPA: hypothetical protein VGY91_07800 [Chthoniobacterales bacterium]|jgi:hypothetical protein|nr:hypothetical protein [Chthoniobacterales bacterium]
MEDLVPDPAPFDHSRAAAFEERLVGVLNAGVLCLMTSLGHWVGLFDAMADMPAARSEAIAARSGLNERYVREWLGKIIGACIPVALLLSSVRVKFKDVVAKRSSMVLVVTHRNLAVSGQTNQPQKQWLES